MAGEGKRGIGRRVGELEGRLRPVGCPTCRSWTGTVLVGLDGPQRPERCPGCGRAVPVRVRVEVGVDLGRL